MSSLEGTKRVFTLFCKLDFVTYTRFSLSTNRTGRSGYFVNHNPACSNSVII